MRSEGDDFIARSFDSGQVLFGSCVAETRSRGHSACQAPAAPLPTGGRAGVCVGGGRKCEFCDTVTGCDTATVGS
jgi:hypothetical protein